MERQMPALGSSSFPAGTVKALARGLRKRRKQSFFRAWRVCRDSLAVQGMGMRWSGVCTREWGTGGLEEQDPPQVCFQGLWGGKFVGPGIRKAQSFVCLPLPQNSV